MQPITNISIADRAAPILRRQYALFQPRERGDVFALAYISSFLNSDGTVVAGFQPGYMRHSLSPARRGDMWMLAEPAGAPRFYFMPKFKWSADEHYLIDVASEVFELLPIG